MDKESLSQYGWVVVLVIIICILLAMATPFGNYIGESTKAVTMSLTSAINNSGIIRVTADFKWTTDPALVKVANTTLLNESFKEEVSAPETPYYIYGTSNGTLIENVNDILPQMEGITYQVVSTPNNVTLGTGSVISAYSGELKVADYYLVILGDIDGDSACDAFDSYEFSKCQAGVTSITGANYMAADIDGDGEITDTDYQHFSDMSVDRISYNDLLVIHGLA